VWQTLPIDLYIIKQNIYNFVTLKCSKYILSGHAKFAKFLGWLKKRKGVWENRIWGCAAETTFYKIAFYLISCINEFWSTSL